MCVAQLDRALGYGPRCRGFESSHARYIVSKEPVVIPALSILQIVRGRFEPQGSLYTPLRHYLNVSAQMIQKWIDESMSVVN